MSATVLEGPALAEFLKIRAWRGAHPGKGYYEAAKALGFKRTPESRQWFDHPELFSTPDPSPAEPSAGAGRAPAGAKGGAVPNAAAPAQKPGPAARIETAFANTAGTPEPSPAGSDPGFRHDEDPAGHVEAAVQPAASHGPGKPASEEGHAEADVAEPARAADAGAPSPDPVKEEGGSEALRRRNAEALDGVDLAALAAGTGGEADDDPEEDAEKAASGMKAYGGAASKPAPRKFSLKGLFKHGKGAGKQKKAKSRGAKKDGKSAEEPISLLGPDMKRAKAKCLNPYVDASNAYRSRMTAISVQIPWLKAGIIVLGLLALGIYAENIVLTNRSHIIPYVMTVDSHGFAIASGTANPLAYDGKGNRALTGTTSPNKTAIGMGSSIDERVIRAALTDFIAKMRDVTPDVQILRDNIKTCYSMIGDKDPSGQALDEWFSGEDPDTGGMNPLVRAEKYIVHVRFVSAVTISANTMQIEWVETTRDRDGARAMPDKKMRANLTWYAGQLKDDIEQIQRNPFGIYVKEFHCSSLSVVDDGADGSGEGGNG